MTENNILPTKSCTVASQTGAALTPLYSIAYIAQMTCSIRPWVLHTFYTAIPNDPLWIFKIYSYMLRDHFPFCPVRSVCNVGVLWPNGWMDQDATWYGGKPRPRWGPSSPYGKGHSLPLFGPCLSWPNGGPSQQLLSSCSLMELVLWHCWLDNSEDIWPVSYPLVLFITQNQKKQKQ